MMDQGHGSSATGTGYSRRGNIPHGPSVTFGYNPKLELDDNEDAMAELDSVSPQDQTVPSLPSRQKSETGAAINNANAGSANAPKRKRPLKLTASQRERKRAIDREAQRSIRIKTKNYIAHLENLVKVMEETDVAGPDGENSRTRELMNQLRQSQEEVRRLRETMLGVQRLLGGVFGDQILERPQHQGSISASPPSVSEAPLGDSFSLSVAGASDPSQNWAVLSQSNDHSSTTTETIHPVKSHQEMPPRPDKDPAKRKVQGEMFYYSEWHLNRVHTAGATAFGNQPFDEDIAVRAIIEGWPAVEERYELDLAWQVLREIDQVVFPEAGVVERIAALRLMRLRLLYQINSKASSSVILPPHMTQEVADLGNHADIIDHFVWPGFRNALMERPEKYITNAFNEKYRHNMKFLWPYEITDTYRLNPMTQLYECTPEFAQRHLDIRCWTMKRQFFDGSEELIGSIPAFEVPLQKSLPAPRTSSFVGVSQPPMGMVEEQEVRETDQVPIVSEPMSAVRVHPPGPQHPAVQHAADMAQWHHPHTVPSQHHGQSVHDQHGQFWQGDLRPNLEYSGHIITPQGGGGGGYSM